MEAKTHTIIQSSANYDRFETITGNRTINKQKVEKLIQDITSGLDLLEYCPIVVFKDGDQFMIVDGQHRFETSRQLEKPVFFVECEKLDLRQIARLNSRSDKWTNRDFLNCYIKLGIEDYKILQQFMSEYSVIYSAAISLLMYGSISSKNNPMDTFRDGEFRVNHLIEAERLTSLCMEVFSRYKFRSNRYLITAMQQIEKKGVCDFEILKEKISKAPNLMNPQNSWKEFVYNIEQVYNHNNKNRTTIF